MKLGIVVALQKAVVLRTVILALVAFAAGWLGSEWVAGSAIPSNSTAKSPVKKFATPDAASLERARAGLVKVMHLRGSPLAKGRAVNDYLENLDEGMVRALLADLLKKPLSNQDRDMLLALARRFGELDPQAAVDWLQGIHDARLYEDCSVVVFDAYSHADPNGALKALMDMPKGSRLGMAAQRVARSFAQQNPQAALAAFSALPDGQRSADNPKMSISAVFSDLTIQDPKAAAMQALMLPDVNDRQLAVDEVAQAWAQLDPAATAAWLSTLPANENSQAISTVILRAGMDDNQAVVAFISDLPGGPNNENLLQLINAPDGYFSQRLADSWADVDPDGLLNWADQSLTGKAYDTAAVTALKQLANVDPASAAAYLATNPDANVVTPVDPALAKAWAQQDPQAALNWAQSLPADNSALRDAALNSVAQGWVATDPSAAAAYVQQNMTNDPDFNAMAAHVANAWGGVGGDPQAALTWAESLPPVAQNRAIVAAVAQMAKADPQIAASAAQTELNSLTGLTDNLQARLQQIAAQTQVQTGGKGKSSTAKH